MSNTFLRKNLRTPLSSLKITRKLSSILEFPTGLPVWMRCLSADLTKMRQTSLRKSIRLLQLRLTTRQKKSTCMLIKRTRFSWSKYLNLTNLRLYTISSRLTRSTGKMKKKMPWFWLSNLSRQRCLPDLTTSSIIWARNSSLADPILSSHRLWVSPWHQLTKKTTIVPLRLLTSIRRASKITLS